MSCVYYFLHRLQLLNAVRSDEQLRERHDHKDKKLILLQFCMPCVSWPFRDSGAGLTEPQGRRIVLS